MTIQSFADTYKAMGPEDKDALKQLKAETEKRIGRDISLGDMIRAVTPGMETPEYLRGC